MKFPNRKILILIFLFYIFQISKAEKTDDLIKTANKYGHLLEKDSKEKIAKISEQLTEFKIGKPLFYESLKGFTKFFKNWTLHFKNFQILRHFMGTTRRNLQNATLMEDFTREINATQAVLKSFRVYRHTFGEVKDLVEKNIFEYGRTFSGLISGIEDSVQIIESSKKEVDPWVRVNGWKYEISKLSMMEARINKNNEEITKISLKISKGVNKMSEFYDKFLIKFQMIRKIRDLIKWGSQMKEINMKIQKILTEIKKK